MAGSTVILQWNELKQGHRHFVMYRNVLVFDCLKYRKVRVLFTADMNCDWQLKVKWNRLSSLPYKNFV